MIKHLQPGTRNSAKLELAKYFQERIGRHGLTLALFKVAHAGGVLPYLKESTRRDFFQGYCHRLEQVGYGWAKHGQHRAPLEELDDVGGLSPCPDGAVVTNVLRWMTLCYLGTKGGRTSYGHVRPVFYSDTAAPIIERLLAAGGDRVLSVLKGLRDDAAVSQRMASCKEVAARYEDLLDVAGDK